MAIELRVRYSFPKLNFRRDLAGYRSPYSDPFQYVSILDGSIPDDVFRVIALGARDKGRADLLELGKHEFEYLIQRAGVAYDPTYWTIAYLDGRPTGFVFPQMYDDDASLGSVWHIGVLPEFRCRGYGKMLHARALETLHALGASRYVGSTEPDNTAMIRIFLANGCRFSSFRIIEEYEDGSGRSLN